MPSLSPRRAGALADALTIASIVALGIGVAAVVDRSSSVEPPESPESSRVVVAPTTEAPVAPTDSTYRTPDVTFPTTIPGCDVVEPPSEGSLTWAQLVTSEDAYDNPQYPWYSGPRSVMMTEALQQALPEGVDIQFGSHRESLVFQPIPQTSVEPGEPVVPGWASASAEMGRGDALGLLSVAVAADTPVPPCVAGAVQERTTSSDGTVTDVNESWYEYGTDRTNFRSVTAYTPDGSAITATASDAEGFPSVNQGKRDTVLTVDELKAIVALPDLLVTAPVPANTPGPMAGCDASVAYTSDGPPIDADAAQKLNDALADVEIDERFEPGLNTLRLADFGTGVVCTHVAVLGTGADISVSILGGQELPSVPDIYDPAYDNRPLSTETLDDGAVLQVDEMPYSYSPAPQEGSTGGLRRTVTVTYPSGTQVEVRSHAERPDEPLGVDTLRVIATADGLDVL